uniref:tRNA-intron lyase n=1 Tax=Meloidogyne enterolobii TaxID=390850 RepID=A0A6V7UKL2_MELEN|nr:unnamed protein product [Meloidogyne enterolobii]
MMEEDISDNEDRYDSPKLESERRKHVKENYQKPIIEPLLDEEEEKYIADLTGMDIIVKLPLHAQRIFSMGNFGTFVGQRMNFANWKCFSSEEQEMCEAGTSKESLVKNSNFDSKQKAKEWIDKNTGGGLLHLTPIEAFYLLNELNVIKINGNIPRENEQIFEYFRSIFGPSFVRKYIVYKYFRKLGWIVRDGLTFGVDFLLYKDGIELHHSCAGIKIVSMSDPIITDISISAVQRELNNCKKQLLIAAIDFKILEENVKLVDIEMAKINILFLNHWNLHKNRAMDLD